MSTAFPPRRKRLPPSEVGPENTAENTGRDGITTAPLVPQPHGGALQVGNPGNHGGTGRPPSVLRERLRGSFEERVKVLEAIADGEVVQRLRLGTGEESEALTSASPADRIKAIDVMGKYGIGTLREISVDQVRERLRETINVINATLRESDADRVLQQLREIWGR